MSRQVYPRGGGLLAPLLLSGAALTVEASPAQALSILREYHAGLETHKKAEVKRAGHSARQ